MMELVVMLLTTAGLQVGELLSSLGLPAIVAGIVAGAFGYLTKKSDHTRPDILSEGYGGLVGSLQDQIANMNARIAQLEDDRERDHETILQLKRDRTEQKVIISALHRRVIWMITKLSAQDKEDFLANFGPDYLDDQTN